MDKSKKIMIGAIGTVVVAGGVIIGLILGRTPPKADLSTIHTEASTEAPAENKPQETKAPETEPSKAPEESVTAISAKVMTYTSGKVSIEYPAIEQMEDEEKQSRINEHLKANALSILDVYEINESADTLSVSLRNHIRRSQASHRCIYRRTEHRRRRSSQPHFLHQYTESEPDEGYGTE